MFFQGRGNTYLQAIAADGSLGPAIKICQDAIAVALNTVSFEHTNKCGPVDVPDYRGTKSASGQVTLTYADVEDKKFAIGALGTLNAAKGSSTPVTGEEMGAGMVEGSAWFLGGTTRHRTITALTIADSDSTPASLVANTDYTLDAETGMVTFLGTVGTFTQPFVAAYTHQDPASVSLLTAAQKSYFLSFENINKAADNDKGSLELYVVRFDPAKNLDFLSDELQSMELVGSVVADLNRAVTDTEFGQFGRRI